MRLRTIASLIAACALSACAHDNAPGAKGAYGGMDWGLNTDSGETKLSYGVPDSDVLWIALSCSPGDPAVNLFLVGTEGRDVVLKSGDKSMRAPGEVVDGMGASAQVARTDAVLSNFADTGELTFGSERRTAPLPAANPGMVQTFLRACR